MPDDNNKLEDELKGRWFKKSEFEEIVKKHEWIDYTDLSFTGSNNYLVYKDKKGGFYFFEKNKENYLLRFLVEP